MAIDLNPGKLWFIRTVIEQGEILAVMRFQSETGNEVAISRWNKRDLITRLNNLPRGTNTREERKAIIAINAEFHTV